MKKLLLIIFLPSIALAHPGIGIVKDSKGNIFYTDLQRVWKISNGKKTVAVPNVHTHELYMDSNDNLYGEGGYYDDSKEKFYHYLWVLRPTGEIDTVVGMKEAYVLQDFSLARDKYGNEYYTRQYLLSREKDSAHVYKKTPDGRETIFATGNFKGVKWLHPQDDGTILYEQNNALYRINASGKIHLIKKLLAGNTPTFSFSQYATIWGIWQDADRNIYVAVFSDQVVRKIDRKGNMTDVYKSTAKWTPLHGVFDNNNQLWVLETSDKNEIRVTLAVGNHIAQKQADSSLLRMMISAGFIIMALLFFKFIDSKKIKRLPKS